MTVYDVMQEGIVMELKTKLAFLGSKHDNV